MQVNKRDSVSFPSVHSFGFCQLDVYFPGGWGRPCIFCEIPIYLEVKSSSIAVLARENGHVSSHRSCVAFPSDQERQVFRWDPSLHSLPPLLSTSFSLLFSTPPSHNSQPDSRQRPDRSEARTRPNRPSTCCSSRTPAKPTCCYVSRSSGPRCEATVPFYRCICPHRRRAFRCGPFLPPQMRGPAEATLPLTSSSSSSRGGEMCVDLGR